jgi:hypothetical protein
MQEIEFMQKKLDIIINDNIKRSNDTIVSDFIFQIVYRIVVFIACLIAFMLVCMFLIYSYYESQQRQRHVKTWK